MSCLKRSVVRGLVTLAVLVAVPAAPATASFPGNNGRIVFEREVPGNRLGDIYTISAGGAGAIDLTATPLIEDRDPAWSADGKWIAFHRYGAGPDELWVMDRKGNGLAVVPGSGWAFAPSWSPDGDSLVYRCWAGPALDADICVRNVDGSGFVQLTATVGIDESGPAWSPDGTRIVFRRELAVGFGSFLVSLDLTSGSSTDLTPQVVGTYDYAPDWSPNNREIAFVRYVAGTGVGGAVYRLKVIGGAPVLVTAPPPGSDFKHTMPAWSPTGTKIAYVQMDDDAGGGHIYTINRNGTGNTQVTFGPAADLYPNWQAT